MDADFLKQKHEAGLKYRDYLATGTDQQQADWQAVYEKGELDEAQSQLLRTFIREMKVICVSGIWCGDCVQQVPLIERIAEARPEKIDLRYLDRDEHADLSRQVTINAGNRVPVIIFAAEDYEPVGWFGDRTLHRYRAVAAKQLGPACPLPGAPVPQDELDAIQQDWLDHFERVHLLLRLSGRLREKHRD